MPFKDAAVFALVMILMGVLLTAAVIAVSLIISLFAGRRDSTGENGGR